MLAVFESLWWLGALLYVTGSIIINLGSNLIRKNHTMYTKETKPPFFKQWLALVGWSLFGLGNVLNFVAFMFAAQSLCAALGSVQFVSNLIFAKFINHETISGVSHQKGA
jgi:magnesium transporter